MAAPLTLARWPRLAPRAVLLRPRTPARSRCAVAAPRRTTATSTARAPAMHAAAAMLAPCHSLLHRRHQSSSTKPDSVTASPSAVPAEDTQDGEMSLGERVLRNIGWLGGFYARRHVLLRSARRLYISAAEQAAQQEFYDLCGLPDTYQSWFLVNHLHVYLLLVRLKQEGKDGNTLYKQLVNLFWVDVKAKMTMAGVDDQTVIKESTRELFSMFTGLVFAYDEGLLGDDATLAAALWRNMFHAQKASIDPVKLELMVTYVRREMKRIDEIPTELLLAKGRNQFGPAPSSQ